MFYCNGYNISDFQVANYDNFSAHIPVLRPKWKQMVLEFISHIWTAIILDKKIIFSVFSFPDFP